MWKFVYDFVVVEHIRYILFFYGMPEKAIKGPALAKAFIRSANEKMP